MMTIPADPHPRQPVNHVRGHTLQTGDLSWRASCCDLEISGNTSFFDSSSLLVRSTCRKKLNMFNLFRHVERMKKSFDMFPKTATCRTATFDMSKQRSTCCFDMLLVWTGLGVFTTRRYTNPRLPYRYQITLFGDRGSKPWTRLLTCHIASPDQESNPWPLDCHSDVFQLYQHITLKAKFHWDQFLVTSS